MGFREDIQKLSVQISERRQHVSNEEMTKQALIIPFFQVLGFDVFDPREVKPEYMSDFGKKKGEKVDYALFKNESPIIFVEAKPVNDPIIAHDGQLARYFNATPEVRLAVITNGVIYKFFTDLNSPNIMDASPFLVVDLTNLTDQTVDALVTFRKESFDTEGIVQYAEETIYTASLNAKIKDILKNPPDDFMRYLIRDFNGGRITSNVLDRFRPLVKKAISNSILDIVSQGLIRQDEPSLPPASIEPVHHDDAKDEEEAVDETVPKNAVLTTEEELLSLDIVRNMLLNAKCDISQFDAKDTVNYYAFYKRVITKWFLRLNINAGKKHIVTRLSAEIAGSLAPGFAVEALKEGSRVFIESVEDLWKLDQLILRCFAEIG